MKLDEAIKYCEQDAGQKDIKDPADFDIDAFMKRFEDLEIAMEVILQAAKNWQTLVGARKDATAGEWLPIETAPKDGSTIMVWREDHGGIWWGSFDGHKWLVVYGNNKVHARDITHWMPLPEPPTEKDTER